MSKNILASLGFALLCSFVADTSVNAENWPGWRGPRGDGSSVEKNVPQKWDGTTGENIVWKIPVPGEGHASPVVWGDCIFVPSCLKDSQDRVLICFDRKTGKKLWQKVVVNSILETKHNLNSFASSTPTTDGKLVYVTFLEVDGSTIPAKNVGRARPVTPGKMTVAAYDFEGNRKWIAQPGGFVSVHGYCSSPVIHDNLLIVNGDHDGDSYVLALNKTTGKTVWKINREHKTRSYVTPLIRTINGRTQMVMSGSMNIISLDPKTGKQLWTIDGPTEQFVASMVFDGERFFMAAGFPTYHVMAIDPKGSGNVSDSHVAWHVKNVRCYVPSPVVIGDYLMVADDRGTANCFSTTSGDRHWQDRLGKHYSASLISANGKAYFLADDGIMKIIDPAKELKVVAENKLGEYCFASPAISQGNLFIRGEKNLYCIGELAAGK